MVEDLQPGMYISRLDRPWLETPFPIQGFLVRNASDKERLKHFCSYVYVDALKSRDVNIPSRLIRNQSVQTLSSEEQIRQLTGRERKLYPRTASREEELANARKQYGSIEKTFHTLLQDAQNDRKLDLPVLKKAITPMVQSIVRNPDAFIWLTHLKKMDSYTYHHAVSSAVWAVAFGRHLGLPETQLNSLATGCFLFDIGKSRLPGELLTSSRRLDDAEFELIKQHVLHSLEMMKEARGINRDILDMIRTHHERHNGSGYPLGLCGQDIPLFGRIAGIVDAYDAITSHRPYCEPVPAYEAIEAFYQWRGIDFQSELVEQFIQVVGIYPVGSLVELSDGTVGVVIAQNEHHRLKPLIMVLLDNQKQLLNEFQEVDLRQAVDDEGISTVTIAKGLRPGAYELDPDLYYF